MESGAQVRAAARAAIGRAAGSLPRALHARPVGRLGLTLGALVLVLSEVSVAGAQATVSTDDDQRRTLLTDAETARTAGDHVRALELAQRAAAIRMSPSLALMIAQEASALGRVVDGVVAARRCVSDATADAALRNRDRILRLCTVLADDLGSRVGELMVRTAAVPVGTHIEVARHEVPSEAWGTAVLVEAGDVEVRATAPDGRTFARTIRVVAGERAEVAVAFATGRGTPASEARQEARLEFLPPQPRRGVGAGPWVLGGVGALAFVSAGVFWALHESAVVERDAACDRTGCDPSSVASNDRARDFTAATNVALIVGGVGLAAGVTWWIIARSRGGDGDATAPQRPTAWVTPGLAGVVVGGTL
jgi:hypothetical protein